MGAIFLPEDAFLDNLPHWYPLCNHDDAKGLDIPQPTVLPPKSNRANSASPRAMSVDRHEHTPERHERSKHGVRKELPCYTRFTQNALSIFQV